jgi:hypothetical protein
MKNVPKATPKTAASAGEFPEYTADNYASGGDTVFLTRAQHSNDDFSQTGTYEVDWDYRSLKGVSQRKLSFIDLKSELPVSREKSNSVTIPIPEKPPVPYYDALKVTGDNYLALGASVLITNMSSYYKKTDEALIQTAISATVDNLPLDGEESDATIPFNFQEEFTKYYFPLSYPSEKTFENTFSINTENIDPEDLPFEIPESLGNFTLEVNLTRKISVDGIGTLSTPYLEVTEALRVVTDAKEIITAKISWTTEEGQEQEKEIKINTTTREIAWFHNEQEYPLLIVNQIFVDEKRWVTAKVEYYDEQKSFEPNALFAYAPVLPTAGGTVTMQNLCTNATEFNWSFMDADKTILAEANTICATYTFDKPGDYFIKLVAKNDTSSDEFTLPVKVQENAEKKRLFHNRLSELRALKHVSIYPQQARNYIVINDLPEDSNLSLFDVKGNCLLRQKAQRVVDVMALKTGKYKLVIAHQHHVREFEFTKK